MEITSELISLKQAIKLYQTEKHAIANAYDWYRKYANKDKYVTIDNINVPAKKISGIWYLEKSKFEEGIKRHRLTIEKIKFNTLDYKKNIFHGTKRRIETDWGYYINYGTFRFVSFLKDTLQGKSDGNWYCNNCNRIADEVGNQVVCKKDKTSLKI